VRVCTLVLGEARPRGVTRHRRMNGNQRGCAVGSEAAQNPNGPDETLKNKMIAQWLAASGIQVA
jgi:hypothetical protein